MVTEPAPEDAVHEILTRVAAIRDVAPTALPPLQETVDVDALGALLDGQFSGTCEFTYADCVVSVGENGRIRVSRCGDAATGKRRHRRRN